MYSSSGSLATETVQKGAGTSRVLLSSQFRPHSEFWTGIAIPAGA